MIFLPYRSLLYQAITRILSFLASSPCLLTNLLGSNPFTPITGKFTSLPLIRRTPLSTNGEIDRYLVDEISMKDKIKDYSTVRAWHNII
ncbi:hypothetical protein HOY80DRAFT_990518 [Tuber brumale]|nr:hypothetical protein HOY80DRAFT_990518 [Tuber brumale]